MCTTADDELAAFPGYVLFNGKRGVPKLLAKLLGCFFLALRDLPTGDHHIMFIRTAIDLDGAEGEIVKLHRRLLGKCGQALFFEVMTEKADQRCSTFLLPQCGHRTSPSSYSTRDKILSKNFLHFWQ